MGKPEAPGLLGRQTRHDEIDEYQRYTVVRVWVRV